MLRSLGILLGVLQVAGAFAQEGELAGLSLEELLNTPVTVASKEITSVRTAPATVHIITESMIQERGYNFLYDALRDAPGLDIIWMGGLYGPILMQRGLDMPENNKWILMIDGVVDNNLSAGTAQIYMQYSLHNVKRIEIIYGPASALYGANAMTGVINIVSKTGEDLQGSAVQAGGMIWDPEGRRRGAFGSVAAGKVWGSGDEAINVVGSFHLVNTVGPDLRLDSEARSDNPSNPAAADYYFNPRYIGSAEVGTFLRPREVGSDRFNGGRPHVATSRRPGNLRP